MLLKVIIPAMMVLFAPGIVAGQPDIPSFTFIDIPHSPRVSGLGSVNVSLSDWDGNMFLSNPALMTAESDRQASFNHYFYYSGIGYNSFSYVHHFDQLGTWGIGLQQTGYGPIKSYDAAGYPLGEVNAGEYAITVGNAHRAGNFSMGGNLKFIFSDIASYRASALMIDIGGAFKHPSRDLTLGLVIHNLGFVMHDYSGTAVSSVPFDVRAGISFKPEHMPFRFSFTGRKLTNFKIPYEANGTGDERPGTFDRVFSHVVIGTELVVNSNLSIMGGYNHLIRKELRLDQVSGGAGFSYGLLLRIKLFSLAYSGASYHVAGISHHLGISVNFSSLYHRKSLS